MSRCRGWCVEPLESTLSQNRLFQVRHLPDSTPFLEQIRHRSSRNRNRPSKRAAHTGIILRPRRHERLPPRYPRARPATNQKKIVGFLVHPAWRPGAAWCSRMKPRVERPLSGMVDDARTAGASDDPSSRQAVGLRSHDAKHRANSRATSPVAPVDSSGHGPFPPPATEGDRRRTCPRRTSEAY